MTEINKGSEIFVYGSGGHAKVVIDVLERDRFRTVSFVVDDHAERHGDCLWTYPVLGSKEMLLEKRKRVEIAGIVAVGDNKARQRIGDWLMNNDIPCLSVIDPSVQLGRFVSVGKNTVVMPGVIINADTIIGDNVIINTGACIDHDCVVEDGAHIAPGSHLCGNVSVGKGALVGAGCTVIPGKRIGANAVVGAGSVVIKDVQDNDTVMGVPARSR